MSNTGVEASCLTEHENKLVENKKNDGLVDGNDVTTNPDDVIQQIGGCGRFQVILTTTIQVMKLVVCWGMVGNTFLAFVPEWECIKDLQPNSTFEKMSAPPLVAMIANTSGMTDKEKCYLRCSRYEFHGPYNTIVSQFDLVCDLSWVTATITSVQMVGMCVGSLVSGHLSDAFGRKTPVFSTMVILCVCHLISYFSVTWVMFAVCKFFIGVASAFFLTIYCTFQGEWGLSRWRSLMIGVPSWPIESCLFALVAFLLPDWKHLALIIASLSFLFFAGWLWIPESFRWYITHGKYKDAEKAVARVARWNKCSVPADFDKMCKFLASQNSEKSTKKYTLITLFKTKALLKLTLPLITTWFTMGYIAYGINFGIKKLSGNIFLNMFLFSIASAPSKLLSIYLQNRIGRRKAGVFAFTLCMIGGTVVGVIQHIDYQHKDSLTNAFALIASVGVDAAWGPLQTLTVEVYPTVIRNTGFGFHSILARLGAVIGPQFVYLGDFVPGIMYFVVGLLSLASTICMFLLPETMDKNLIDEMSDDLEAHRTTENKLRQTEYNEMPMGLSENIEMELSNLNTLRCIETTNSHNSPFPGSKFQIDNMADIGASLKSTRKNEFMALSENTEKE